MATDMGKLQKKKNMIWPIIWRRDASRDDSQGSMIVSCEILIFVNPCSNMIEMKMFVSNGTDLAEQNFTYRMSESEYFHYRQNWWIPLNKSGDQGPLRKRSDFNQALSTLNRLHREAGGQQLRPMHYWKYQKRQPSSSSSSTWWQWSASWWSS